jgi:hypothetical protein
MHQHAVSVETLLYEMVLAICVLIVELPLDAANSH